MLPPIAESREINQLTRARCLASQLVEGGSGCSPSVLPPTS